MASLLSFPNPVNEKAARTVAGLVVVAALVALATRSEWLVWLLAAGFLLRIASGPRFSPFGIVATRLVAPRLGTPRLVAGPPKRFAQGMGVAFSLASALCLATGATVAGWVLLALLVVAATLEAVFAICVGCRVFGLLQRAGVVPESVCEACSDIWSVRAEGAGAPAAP